MKRIRIAPRSNWQERAHELGFAFHSLNGETYWDESAYYAFGPAEMEREIEDPAQELEELCHAAVARIVASDGLMDRMRIPRAAWSVIRKSWRDEEPSLYGRFDFSYTGKGPAKLLEYNADTPTALYEASAFQWFWLEDQLASGALPAGADQFNSIHEKLVARFGQLAGQGALHFTSVDDSIEDRGTVDYLADCARQGGFETKFIAVTDIGLGDDGKFYDLENREIERLFKLYPWEWLFAEEFGRAIAGCGTGFLEPAWRSVLSNKGLLPILWEMAPNHRNLLPAYFADEPAARELNGACVVKPLFSREGANVTMYVDGRVADSQTGSYGQEGSIVQGLAPLPCFDGNHAVVGAWVVAGQSCGVGIREDSSPITKNTSRFVPHALVG